MLSTAAVFKGRQLSTAAVLKGRQLSAAAVFKGSEAASQLMFSHDFIVALSQFWMGAGVVLARPYTPGGPAPTSRPPYLRSFDPKDDPLIQRSKESKKRNRTLESGESLIECFIRTDELSRTRDFLID